MAGRRGRPRDTAARARILEVAADRFTRNGFLATTVGEVADAAGVAVQTIYMAFGSKVGLLSAAHDAAVAGDDEDVPLLEREWFRRLSEMPSAAAAWSDAVEHLAWATDRVAPIYGAIQSAAADSDVGAVLTSIRAQRREFSVVFTDLLLSLPGCDPRADRARVADVVYATIAAECYAMLVTECGWSVGQWREWVHGVVARELIA